MWGLQSLTTSHVLPIQGTTKADQMSKGQEINKKQMGVHDKKGIIEYLGASGSRIDEAEVLLLRSHSLLPSSALPWTKCL